MITVNERVHWCRRYVSPEGPWPGAELCHWWKRSTRPEAILNQLHWFCVCMCVYTCGFAVDIRNQVNRNRKWSFSKGWSGLTEGGQNTGLYFLGQESRQWLLCLSVNVSICFINIHTCLLELWQCCVFTTLLVYRKAVRNAITDLIHPQPLGL